MTAARQTTALPGPGWRGGSAPLPAGAGSPPAYLEKDEDAGPFVFHPSENAPARGGQGDRERGLTE